MTNRSLSAISKERSRDEAALDRIKHKVEIGELTTADAPDVKANIEHFAKRNEERMQWAEEMLVETSKARATIEKSYHKINKVITAIDDKLILPAGLAIDSGKAAAAPDKPATKKKAKGKAKTADKGKTPRKRQTSVAEDGYKVCFTCGKKLSVDQFDKDKTKKDGLKHKCKSCVKAYREARKAG